MTKNISQSLPSISGKDIKKLSLAALVKRMDDIRVAAEIERYGTDIFKIKEKVNTFPRVADLLSTTSIKEKEEPQQRRLADAAFRFLLQMDMLTVSYGIANSVVYGPGYQEENWASPRYWMKVAVLEQYQIIASRIALECFFDLIYITHRGDRMPGRSKFSTFRNWVCEPNNPFKYFVGHIIHAFNFDRKHRQKEVHGTSRFAQNLLRLEPPEQTDRNISTDLANVLLSVWSPLVRILNGERPTSIAVFKSCDEFASKYLHSLEDPENFDIFVENILATNL